MHFHRLSRSHKFYHRCSRSFYRHIFPEKSIIVSFPRQCKKYLSLVNISSAPSLFGKSIVGLSCVNTKSWALSTSIQSHALSASIQKAGHSVNINTKKLGFVNLSTYTHRALNAKSRCAGKLTTTSKHSQNLCLSNQQR